MQNECFFCGAPWHPSTGGGYKTTFNGIERFTRACGNCAKEALRFTANWTGKGVGKKHIKTAQSFYEAATNEYAIRIP